MLNGIWLGLMLAAVLYAAFAGDMQAVTDQIFASAESGITLVIELTGIMIFMLGLMRVAQDGGAMRWIALRLAPVMRRLFPDVPADHPAMSAMLMNFTANMFGLGNAATPFGLKAMAELRRLNPVPGVASNPMILFLAINTSAITLMPPNGTIAVRAAAGSADPFAVWLPTLIATTCSTLAAVGVFYLLRDRKRYAVRPLENPPEDTPEEDFAIPEETDVLGAARAPMELWRKLVLVAVGITLAAGFSLGFADALERGSSGDAAREMLRAWLFPLLVSVLLLIGFAGRVRVYESAIAGAREGLSVVVRIIPYLVLILVAVGMFRASGALDLLIQVVDPVTRLIGIPGEVLPMALLRPLSGSGAFAVMSEILAQYGPDSFVGLLASTLQGSTETTFYVLTLYAGAAGVRDVRFALIACLCGDFAGLLGATAACHLFFG